jgi:hypothetical protein
MTADSITTVKDGTNITVTVAPTSSATKKMGT